MWLGPSLTAIAAPIAFATSVLAVKRDRFGLYARAALALSSLEFVFVAGMVLLNLIF